MQDSSSIRGNVFWPAMIVLGGMLITAFFLVFGQPVELAIGASLSFVVLAFVSLMAGAGRAESEDLQAPHDKQSQAAAEETETIERLVDAGADAEGPASVAELENGSGEGDV